MSSGTGDFSATSPGYGMHSSGLNQEQLQERQEERSHHASNPITTTTSRLVSDVTQSHWNTRFFADDKNNSHTVTQTYIGSSMEQFSSMASAGVQGGNNISPTTGGFIENRADFINFMTNQAKINPVEVAAFEINDRWSGQTRFFVQPWQGFDKGQNGQSDWTGNTAESSHNQVNWLLQYGYNDFDVQTQYHTHPVGRNPGPSIFDAGLTHGLIIGKVITGLPIIVVDFNGDQWGTFQHGMKPINQNYGNKLVK